MLLKSMISLWCAGDDPVQRPEVPEAQPQQQAQATIKAEGNRARGRGRGREGRGRPERDNGELPLTGVHLQLTLSLGRAGPRHLYPGVFCPGCSILLMN